MATRRKKRPGRPSGRQPTRVRRALLDAARAVCIEVGLDAASSQSIAERAGVNPAMINYYFGGKEGLCEAMIRDAIQPLLEKLDELAAAKDAAVTLPAFLRGYMRAIAANPWLPRLVVREVLPANGRFRALFLEELATRAMAVVPGLIERERAAGRVGSEREPELVILSMFSLAIFPFLAAPVVEPALGIDLGDPASVERLITHAIDVLERGVGGARS